jgi:hypothetical protein
LKRFRESHFIKYGISWICYISSKPNLIDEFTEELKILKKNRKIGLESRIKNENMYKIFYQLIRRIFIVLICNRLSESIIILRNPKTYPSNITKSVIC